MELSGLDTFFLNQSEPHRGCFLALREIILNWDSEITEHYKYSVPFYHYKGKPFCFLYRDKKSLTPYISLIHGGEISHPLLFRGNRKLMQIILISPERDIPKIVIYETFDLLRNRY